jgi:hypothetical protein
VGVLNHSMLSTESVVPVSILAYLENDTSQNCMFASDFALNWANSMQNV